MDSEKCHVIYIYIIVAVTKNGVSAMKNESMNNLLYS